MAMKQGYFSDDFDESTYQPVVKKVPRQPVARKTSAPKETFGERTLRNTLGFIPKTIMDTLGIPGSLIDPLRGELLPSRQEMETVGDRVQMGKMPSYRDMMAMNPMMQLLNVLPTSQEARSVLPKYLGETRPGDENWEKVIGAAPFIASALSSGGASTLPAIGRGVLKGGLMSQIFGGASELAQDYARPYTKQTPFPKTAEHLAGLAAGGVATHTAAKHLPFVGSKIASEKAPKALTDEAAMRFAEEEKINKTKRSQILEKTREQQHKLDLEEQIKKEAREKKQQIEKERIEKETQQAEADIDQKAAELETNSREHYATVDEHINKGEIGKKKVDGTGLREGINEVIESTEQAVEPAEQSRIRSTFNNVKFEGNNEITLKNLYNLQKNLNDVIFGNEPTSLISKRASTLRNKVSSLIKELAEKPENASWGESFTKAEKLWKERVAIKDARARHLKSVEKRAAKEVGRVEYKTTVEGERSAIEKSSEKRRIADEKSAAEAEVTRAEGESATHFKVRNDMADEFKKSVHKNLRTGLSHTPWGILLRNAKSIGQILTGDYFANKAAWKKLTKFDPKLTIDITKEIRNSTKGYGTDFAPLFKRTIAAQEKSKKRDQQESNYKINKGRNGSVIKKGGLKQEWLEY